MKNRPNVRSLRELDDDAVDDRPDVGFGSSGRLAGAYGTAVSTTMLLTTALLYKVMRDRWGWSAPTALLTSGVFLLVDFGAQ